MAGLVAPLRTLHRDGSLEMDPARALTEKCMQTQAHPLEPFFNQEVSSIFEGKLA